MIATLAEIKTILGISDTSKDAQITALIPMVESEIYEYCNNYFLDQDISFGGQCTITVVGSVYKIECASGSMNTVGFASGDKFLLQGSKRNDNYYTISSIASGYIQTVEPMIAELTALSMTMTLASFPVGLKIYMAKMISYQVYHANDSGLTSETIGNYSYSRNSGSYNSGNYGYPSEILKGLDKWRNVSTKRAGIHIQFRDYRGSTAYLSDDLKFNDYLNRIEP